MIVSTSDGGKSWRELTRGERRSLQDIDFRSRELGWVVGSEGMIESYCRWRKELVKTGSSNHRYPAHS
jgi:photosystem II stability/assembly factor-like uncharacterized protein